MVAAGDERGTGGRAERGGVKVQIAQPVVRNVVQCRRWNHAAESARRGEADVVGHDQQDVGRALGRHNPRRPAGFRLIGVELDLALEFGRWWRQIFCIQCLCSGRRASRARWLLRSGRECRNWEKQENCKSKRATLYKHGSHPLASVDSALLLSRVAHRSNVEWNAQSRRMMPS